MIGGKFDVPGASGLVWLPIRARFLVRWLPVLWLLSFSLLSVWPGASFPAAQQLRSATGSAPESAPDFRTVYDILAQHCGACHVKGIADGPWSLNTAPSDGRFPSCLVEIGAAQLRCATYHQLVDEPAPGIPAWIRPGQARLSEPYLEACDPSASFHIGHSLPAALPGPACAVILHWIESGAQR